VTVVRSERRVHKPAPKLDEVEQIKRLVEIQKEIVELAKQNELTAKECDALRHELAQSTRRPPKGWGPAVLLAAWVERLKSAVKRFSC
jgi:hypothetical protein